MVEKPRFLYSVTKYNIGVMYFMAQTPKRKRSKQLVLIYTIVTAIALYVFSIVFCRDDEYVFGWLSSFAQALFIFAVFRFDCIKRKLKNQTITEKTLFSYLAMAALITGVGKYFEKLWIAQLGSAVAMLGLNALVSYLDYAFSESEEKERKERKREKRRTGK